MILFLIMVLEVSSLPDKHKQIEEEVVVLGKEVKAVMLEKEAKLEVESELEAVLLGKDM
jgi:hypothetical protein